MMFRQHAYNETFEIDVGILVSLLIPVEHNFSKLRHVVTCKPHRFHAREKGCSGEEEVELEVLLQPA